MRAKSLNPDWYVYVVRCRDGSLYTGIAKSLKKRLAEHNTDNQLGAKYTRSRRPVELVYHEHFTSRALAARRESAIKRLSKKQKETLIALDIHHDCVPKKNNFD